MTTRNHKAVRIVEKAEKTTLSQAQKKFNSLTKKIDAQKKLLQEWQDAVPQYQQRVSGEYETLWDRYNDYRVELVHLLDAAYCDKQFKKTDKNKIQYVISDTTMELIEQHGKDELKELYNKYNETDFDSQDQRMNEAVGDLMKSIFQDMFNVEIAEEVDVSSPEKFSAVLEEKLREKENQQREDEQKRKPRKKTAKQLEKEAQQQQEEQNISKSIQAVFRQLAAALHPDREMDEAERERKTRIMQQVNVAYAKKDLLQLLSLQLEFEQIDQNQINNIAEDRLKHFNIILQQQLDELQQEIEQYEMGFKMQLDMPPYFKFSPKQLLGKLNADIKDMQISIMRIQHELKNFKNPLAVKAWLKTIRI